MRRLARLLVACLFLITSTAFAETSFDASSYSLAELMEIRALIDAQINTLAETPSEELVPGSYVAGQDIAAGSYVVHGLMDKGPDGYTPQVLIANSLEDASSWDYICWDYMKANEKWFFTVKAGNVIEVRSGTVSIEQAPMLLCAPGVAGNDEYSANATATLVPGYYTAGRDIVAGDYILVGLMDKGPDGYTPQVLLAESMDAASSWEYISSDYMKKGELWRIHVADGNILEVRSGDVSIQKVVPLAYAPDEAELLAVAEAQNDNTPAVDENAGDRFTVVKGVYIVGRDVQAGSYTLTMTDCKKSTLIAIFASAKDLSSYTSWDSSSNLGKYGKTGVYISKDTPTHIILEEGDRLYISDGQGYLTPAVEGTVTRGVYAIGKDLVPGSYLITLNDFHNSSLVATFANSSDLMSYISWDSSNNLAEYSSSSVYVKKGEQFHVTLIEGEYLYISEGTGSYTIQ